MAKPKNDVPEEPTTDSAETIEEAVVVESPFRAMHPEAAQDLLAAKQAAGEPGRTWNLKKSTEIPDRFDKAEVTILQPKLGVGDPAQAQAQTWANILVFCNGDHQAALDTFNSAYRLDDQKMCKGEMMDTSTTLANIQELANRHYATPLTRGKGGSRPSTKAKIAKAETKAAEATASAREMLEELRAINPEAAAKYEAKLASLNI